MDWSKAKNVLIISFLLLNLLLGYQLWISKGSLADSTADSASAQQEVKQKLSAKDIRLEASVPGDTPKLKSLTIRYAELTKSTQRSKLEIPLRTDELFNKEVPKEALEKQIAHAETYQLDSSTSKPGEYVLNQMYADLPMFEVALTLYVQDNVVSTYSQGYADVQAGVEQKEQRVLSAYTAISSLSDYLPAGAVITDVKLGFHGQFFDSETQVLVPSWRVTLGNGELYYVDAITGSVPDPQKGK